MKLDLTGKNVVISGGCGILGKVFAEALAEAGARPVLLDLDGDSAAAVAGDLSARHGCGSLGFACDVSDPASVASVFAKVVAACGEIHVLINNAASKSQSLEKFFSPFEDFPFETWREVMAVNVDGMFLMAQAAARQMIRQGKGGVIIQLASIYGVVAPDQRIYEGAQYLGQNINTPAVYSTSKAAVIGLSQHLATLLAHHGIRVNTLTPGGVESGQNSEFQRRYSDRVPLGRMAKSEEIASALVFLASDASSYMTGHNLIVDGGWTVW